ncbi:MAG: Gfo/Idh/MocA family oxidoreductase [Clostridia bacterium]|nr:Gfo/Idh/MocA family oxidoreductase [Clostridia bacterium]
MKNACIVGYGAIGPVHADAIDQLEQCSLYAVCDINADRAKKCTDKYNCLYYSDFDTMLHDDNIDVVHVCTPHYLHKSMAMAALAAGKDVVLEKPVAMTRSKFEELEAFADNIQNGKKVCVMLQNRTNACVVKMMDIFKNDDSTGKLEGILANLAWHRDEEYYNQDPWRGNWKYEGGGLLINQAVHLLDLMVYFGGDVSEVKSNISHWYITNIEVEDNANALIKFTSGINGVFNATNCHSTDAPFYLELQFENMRLRYADGALYKICDDDIQIIEHDKKAEVGKAYWGSGHQRVIDAFYSSLHGDDTVYADIHDARNAMELVYSMYEKGLSD